MMTLVLVTYMQCIVLTPSTPRVCKAMAEISLQQGYTVGKCYGARDSILLGESYE
jgi:hypothetical protein